MEAKGCESCRYGHAGGVAGGFRRRLKEADVVVLRPHTTSRDIEPLCMCRAMFKSTVARNRARHERLEPLPGVRDFMEWFRGLAGDQTVTAGQAFVQAQTGGRSVVSTTVRARPRRRQSMVSYGV